MDIIKAPTTITDTVYRGEFIRTQPPESIELTGNDKGTNQDAEIEQRLSGNIMEVGKPEYWNLKQLCMRKDIQMAQELEVLLDRFDFWLIQSAYSFIPAHGSQFTWARIVTLLEGLSDDPESPIAYDVFPRNISQEKNKEKEINIGLNFKFKTIIETKADYVQKIALTTLEPVISVAGVGKSKPTWDFSNKAAFCLQDVNTLFIILKTPVNSKGIKISYFSHAEISTKWGGVFPTTSKPKGEESYELEFL